MYAGVNVHVRLAARPCPSILAVVVRMAGGRGESVFSDTFSFRTTKNIDTALSDSVSGKGTRTVRSGRHMASRTMNCKRRSTHACAIS